MSAPAYRRLSVEERRSQLLEAALSLFAHRAPEEVSLDDVAEAAGVSRPLVYRYFPGGKQQLYEAALRSAAEELEQCFEEPPEGPAHQRLARALDRYLAFVGRARRRVQRAAPGRQRRRDLPDDRHSGRRPAGRGRAHPPASRRSRTRAPAADDRADVDHGGRGGLADLARRGQAAAGRRAAGLAGGAVRRRASR